MNKFVARAFEIAAAVDPHAVTPNPRVGCVIVRGGEIIAEGAHEFVGGPHAEINAIGSLEDLQDCEVYVTLEPCDCFPSKRTGSCVDLLIEKKSKKVVIGQLDPKFGGQSVEKLQNAGIEVEVRGAECEMRNKELNPFFEHYQKHQKPWITLKIAQSLDGKITGGNPYITNEASLKKVHEMRAQYSAILTTTQTVLSDDPRLDCRLVPGSNPTVIILGRQFIPESAQVWQILDREVIQFATLSDFLQSDRFSTIDSIMTECGSQMNTTLLEKELVNEIQLFIAPKILGNHEKQNFEKEVNLDSFELNSVENLDGDLWQRLLSR